MIDYKKELNEEQYAAVMYNSGPLLIIATAGSGKTRCLTYKTAKLIEDGVKPENILLLTFTNRAAHEMLSRVSEMLGSEVGNITACTYHSFCVELLRKYIHLIGYENNFTILGSSDAEDAVTILKSDFEEQKEADFPSSKEFLSILSLSKNKELPLDKVIASNEKALKYNKILLELEQKYEDYKEERNLLDYNDIIYLTNMVLEMNPTVRKKVGEQYTYKMIDEYQDTSALQARFIKNLCMYGNDKITVVGDDAQSIFSFSGAEPKNILEFPDKFKNCKKIVLNKNYRSTQEILDIANASIDCMKEKYDKKLISVRGKGNRPVVYSLRDNKAEADFIMSSINDICHRDYELLKDTAIISRRSFDTFYLESIFIKNKVPYKKYGGLKLSEKVYIRDILAYLKVIVNEKDEIAWFRLLNLCEGVGTVTAKTIIPNLVKNGKNELISEEYKKKKYCEDLKQLFIVLTDLEDLKSKSLKQMLEYIVPYYFEEKTNRIYKKKTSAEKRNRELMSNENDREESDILFSLAADYKNCQDFLSDLVLEQPDNKEKANIVITTIHSAKGLEFDTVFYMNCVLFQNDFAEGNVEEARRCFYVAVTRAKNNLIITYPQYSYVCGKWKNNEPSAFLTEASKGITWRSLS